MASVELTGFPSARDIKATLNVMPADGPGKKKTAVSFDLLLLLLRYKNNENPPSLGVAPSGTCR